MVTEVLPFELTVTRVIEFVAFDKRLNYGIPTESVQCRTPAMVGEELPSSPIHAADCNRTLGESITERPDLVSGVLALSWPPVQWRSAVFTGSQRKPELADSVRAGSVTLGRVLDPS